MDAAARLTPDALLQHEAFVLRLARSLVHDEATAQDVAQETWLTALERPPQPGAVRAWLARVTRNHALNLRRGDRRRGAREASVALPEAYEAGRSSQERLELQHGVVSAVLELDEPYRSVVIAVYYDGRTPSEIARQRRAAPGTVRSQLSRALDRLRERLDREHGGDRSAWSLALAGLLRVRDNAAVGAGTAATGLPWLAVTLGVAAVGLAVGVAWHLLEPSPAGRDGAAAAVAVPPDPVPASAGLPLSREQEPARVPVQVVATEEEAAHSATDDLLAELDELLARTRQVRALIVAGRTEVEPEVRRAYAWLEGRPDAGVVRLVDRAVFEDRLDLPWLRGGGATWSFTERTHDAGRRPQLQLEQEGLGVPSLGGGKGVVIELGEVPFRSLVLDPVATAATFDDEARAAWELGHRELVVEEGMDRLELQQALRELRRDDEVEPEEGSVYLVRAFAPGQHDVLAVVEVARVEREGCTLAWKLLESRPVAGAQPVPDPEGDAAEPAEPPRELLELDERGLLARLEALRSQATTLLHERLPAAMEDRLGDVSRHPGAGRARVVDAASPWVELVPGEDGASAFSFATRGYGWDSEPDVRLQGGAYSMDFNARSITWLLDLGAVPLEEAEASAAERHASAWSLMSRAELPHFADQAGRVEAQVQLMRRASELGLESRVRAEVGHTYLVRSIFPTWHDHLVAFHVAHRDPAGDVLAWRVLRTWEVDRRR